MRPTALCGLNILTQCPLVGFQVVDYLVVQFGKVRSLFSAVWQLYQHLFIIEGFAYCQVCSYTRKAVPSCECVCLCVCVGGSEIDFLNMWGAGLGLAT